MAKRDTWTHFAQNIKEYSVMPAKPDTGSAVSILMHRQAAGYWNLAAFAAVRAGTADKLITRQNTPAKAEILSPPSIMEEYNGNRNNDHLMQQGMRGMRAA